MIYIGRLVYNFHFLNVLSVGLSTFNGNERVLLVNTTRSSFGGHLVSGFINDCYLPFNRIA